MTEILCLFYGKKKKKKRAKDRKAPVMSALTSWINYISILKDVSFGFEIAT